MDGAADKGLFTRGVKYSTGAAACMGLALAAVPQDSRLMQMLAGGFFVLAAVLFVVGWWPWLRSTVRSPQLDEPLGFQDYRRSMPRTKRRLLHHRKKALKRMMRLAQSNSANVNALAAFRKGSWLHSVMAWFVAGSLIRHAKSWERALPKYRHYEVAEKRPLKGRRSARISRALNQGGSDAG